LEIYGFVKRVHAGHDRCACSRCAVSQEINKTEVHI